MFLYLVDVCENIVDFMKGIFLFLIGVVFYGDKIFEFLIKELIYDIDVEIIFRVLLLLIWKVVFYVYKDYLLNGRYELFIEEFL